MDNKTFVRLTRIEASVKEVFDWHGRPGATKRLTPPWIDVLVVERNGGLEDGSRISLVVKKRPFHFQWILEHSGYEPERQFRDIQIKGPFAYWAYTHTFEPDRAACYIQDCIEYRLPFGPLGRFFFEARLRCELERLFVYRHRVIGHDIPVHRAYPGVSSLRILVTGSSGLIGSSLVAFLSSGGHTVMRLVRTPENKPDAIYWNPDKGEVDREALEGFDVVIHLAGEPLSGKRWNKERKKNIYESRIQGSTLLAETLASLKTPPHVFMVASAVGYYGNRGSELLDEESQPGRGFLSGVCVDWETAANVARDRGIRVVNLRFGMVLTPAGGALRVMLPIFNLGLGGPVGDGWQFVSWISMDDALEAIYHCMLTDSIKGPVNIVAPYAATNRDFAKMFGTILNRPALFKLPEWLVRMAMGEMAGELLLSSTRVEPRGLTDTGFIFHFPDLESALRHVLGRT